MTTGRNSDEGEKERSVVSYAVGLGFAIAIPLALFIVGGVWLDGLLNTRPLFVLLGILLGFISAGYSFWRLIAMTDTTSKKNQKK